MKTALRMMCDAYQRLKDFGWNDAIYCPKDGSIFDVIEAGSSAKVVLSAFLDVPIPSSIVRRISWLR